jgi:hypothetical protein
MMLVPVATAHAQIQIGRAGDAHLVTFGAHLDTRIGRYGA